MRRTSNRRLAVLKNEEGRKQFRPSFFVVLCGVSGSRKPGWTCCPSAPRGKPAPAAGCSAPAGKFDRIEPTFAHRLSVIYLQRNLLAVGEADHDSAALRIAAASAQADLLEVAAIGAIHRGFAVVGAEARRAERDPIIFIPAGLLHRRNAGADRRVPSAVVVAVTAAPAGSVRINFHACAPTGGAANKLELAQVACVARHVDVYRTAFAQCAAPDVARFSIAELRIDGAAGHIVADRAQLYAFDGTAKLPDCVLLSSR